MPPPGQELRVTPCLIGPFAGINRGEFRLGWLAACKASSVTGARKVELGIARATQASWSEAWPPDFEQRTADGRQHPLQQVRRCERRIETLQTGKWEHVSELKS